MAPEQVRGLPVDARTDLFAFGAVLYEMISGRRAFQGETGADTMTAVLTSEPPDLSETVRTAPPALDLIVRHCLEKRPEERFQSARDLAFDLELLSSPSASGTRAGVESQQSPTQHVSHSPGASRLRRWLVPIALAGLAIVGLTLLLRFGVMRSAPTQPQYGQVTYRQGWLTAARFAPDGQTVIYSAAWNHPQVKIYSSHMDGTNTSDLGLPAGELLAISRSGELAVALHGKGREDSRLARVPLGKGAPRELLDDVTAADWSPDGSQLAVAHFVNGKVRLEYPIGKSLYETLGFITHMRFSPQGDAIAFMDHPLSGDDRGSVMLLDLKNGAIRKLTGEWAGELGLAWSQDGSEVWFTATNTTESDRALYAVDRKGKQRLVLRSPGGLYLEDIGRDGRALLTQNQRIYEVIAAQNRGEPHQISWLQIMNASALSHDGKFALVSDESGSTGLDYGVYLTPLDGSPAILLGSGSGSSISADDKWVTSILPSDTTKVLLLPTGIGETRTVTAPNFRYERAIWTANGRALAVSASEGTHPFRFWVQDVNGGSPRALTPEGLEGRFVDVHGRDYIAVREADRTVRLYPIDGGEPRTVPGISPSDDVLGGAADSDVLYITPDSSAIPLQLLKLDITTGKRKPFLILSPTNPAGVIALYRPIFTRDEKSYVYGQLRTLSVLYVATGLK